MSWKVWAVLAAGVFVVPPARASDLFHLALPAKGTPPPTVVSQGGIPYYRTAYRPDPRFHFGVGVGVDASPYLYAAAPYFPPPPYDYPPPGPSLPPVISYSTATGIGVTVYSLPEGNVSYTVTRPPPGPEPVVMPVPKPSTFPYDGGPDNPVPMPPADPSPASAPRYFHMPPRDDVLVSLPAEAKRGKFAYPAYGEKARGVPDGPDRVIIIRDTKKGGR